MGNWFNKLKWKFARFMQGRYGNDSLNWALLIAALVFMFAASLSGLAALSWVALALLIWSTFRTYSKNIAARRRENEVWGKLANPIAQWFRVMKKRWAERKTHCYFRCPKCKTYLRVPKGKGTLRIRCSNCGEELIKKT